jgi:histidine triad (HIT) family protein
LVAEPFDPDCKFCRIVAGDGAADIVFRDDRAVAFLDHRPLFPGHVLLLPRGHYETLGDLPPDHVDPLFQRARRLSRAMEEVLGATGSFVALNNRVSQSVPHLHVHVVPRNRKDGLRGFFWPRSKYSSPAEAAAIAARLQSWWESAALESE